MIKIATVQGSVRPDNYTAKALALVHDEIEKQGNIELIKIDPTNLELPLPGKGETEDAKRMQEELRKATGIILATPEYHGSFSSVMKLVIENMGFPSGLAGKPIALLGVAAGRIGAIKSLEHLRSVCSHVGGIVLPAPVSIANVNKYFDENGKCTDEATEKVIRSVATNLLDYINGFICPAKALEEMVRENNG